MALSKEEKEALNDHYKNKDLYDPSKAQEQEVTTFAPKEMNCGGMTGGDGYAEGGEIDLGNMGGFDQSDFSGPALSAGTDTPRGLGKEKFTPPMDLTMSSFPVKTLSTAPVVSQTPARGPGLPALPVKVPPAVSGPQNAPEAVQAPRKGLSPDQFDALIRGLQPSLGQRIGQGAMSGLAGLADAIESGVAGAGNTNFQKNIEEGQQNQKKNLIEALRNKYEVGYKGKELDLAGRKAAEEALHNRETEKETRAARSLTERQQNLVAAQHGEQLGVEQRKSDVDAAQKVLDAFHKSSSLPFTAGPTQADYAKALKIVQGAGASAAHPQDQQAVAWARANPSDPRSAKILKANGQ